MRDIARPRELCTHAVWYQVIGTRRHLQVLGLCTLIATALGGCGGNGFLAPLAKDPRVSDLTVPKRQPVREHVVRRGETLYAIAFRYGLDYRQVAQSNAIGAPYLIFPGQRLRIDPNQPLVLATKSTKPSAANSGSATQTKQAKQTNVQSSPQTSNQTTAASSNSKQHVEDDDNNAPVSTWNWPARGKLLTTFKSSGNKGIDIGGDLGHPVRAAAAGKVVYSGGGLIGFGELIIIKHNKHYLSAYGHNNKLRVKQGDIVELGQHIADMGHSGTDTTKLHFEIRRDGKPVDPIRYLPK